LERSATIKANLSANLVERGALSSLPNWLIC
jgi:hypothetical protein